MTAVFDCVTLHGSHVLLEPLDAQHHAAMVLAASCDRSTFTLTSVPEPTEDAVTSYINEARRQFDAGLGLTFATIRCADRALIGSTRFMNAEYWRASTTPPSHNGPIALEIGSTWLVPEAQRTAANTEAKILMLDYAFDVLRVARVTLKTDERNEPSRRNIERIGATFDGVLRRHMPASDGGYRDSAMYSLLDTEWPQARARLLGREYTS